MIYVIGNILAIIGLLGFLFGWMLFLGTKRPIELVLLVAFGWVLLMGVGGWMMKL